MSLRIGILCHDSVGGSVRVATLLVSELASRGHEVHVFARRPPLELRSGDGIVLHTLSGSESGHRPLSADLDLDWSRAEVEKLARLVAWVIRREELDLVHFHYGFPLAEVAALAVRLAGGAAAVVGTLHGTDVTILGRKLAVRERLAASLERANALTTVSQNHAALAAETFALTRPPEVIPNFVDTGRFRPATRDSVERPRVVHVSNFRDVKRPLAVGRVFRDVRRRLDADLWLIGDGRGMSDLKRRLECDGLAGEVTCFGLRLDLERILPEADVLLVTSRTESFCLAALEAAACGVPSVAPRVGGLPETVVDGETGVLFGPGDDVAAAAAVGRLLEDGERRRLMATAAIRRARQFAAEEIVPRYERLYLDVLGTAEAAVAPGVARA